MTTADGVTIGGTVRGQGPPLVFVHGMMGDGDLDWRALVEHLAGRFTCHLPSVRGRGLSGEHPDLSIGRLIDDVVAYVDSLQAPTGLVGWSSGAYLAVGAVAARPDAVNAVAAFELGVLSLMDEQEQGAFADAVARLAQLAAEGRARDAIRAFAGWPFTDADIAAAEGAGYFEAAGRYVPHLLGLLRQWGEHRGPAPDDPAALGGISAPVLVLHGAETKRFLISSARYVADHVPTARREEIPGAGHAAPLTRPSVLAEALSAFFSSTPPPGRRPPGSGPAR